MDIHTYCWDGTAYPKAAVQIMHGMAEHAGRYGRFAEYLNKNGYIVYANDHRGHGKTAGTVDEMGFIGKDGFNRIVEDTHILTRIIKEKHPDLPVILLGHSFGSFEAQEYITRYGDRISGLILSGSSMKNGLDVKAGKFIPAILIRFTDERKISRLADNLSFGSFNKPYKGGKTMFAWLSRDNEEVRKYDEDPFCGGIFTTNFFYYFTKGLSELYKKDKLAKIPLKLQIFIVSGDSDPVGSYGKGVARLYQMYRRLGIRDVRMKLYPGARHEILNEINREEVFDDILMWLDMCIKTNHNLTGE